MGNVGWWHRSQFNVGWSGKAYLKREGEEVCLYVCACRCAHFLKGFAGLCRAWTLSEVGLDRKMPQSQFFRSNSDYFM